MTKDRTITSGMDENRFEIEQKYRVSVAIRRDPGYPTLDRLIGKRLVWQTRPDRRSR